jgi:hypothetical protein
MADNTLGIAPMAPDSVVYDCAGKELGRLAEMRESYFKLDVKMAPDYWLPVHLIDQVDGDRITLNVRDGEFDGDKLDGDAIDMTEMEIEEATDDTLHPEPMERRYQHEAEYLTHPHPLT